MNKATERGEKDLFFLKCLHAPGPTQFLCVSMSMFALHLSLISCSVNAEEEPIERELLNAFLIALFLVHYITKL